MWHGVSGTQHPRLVALRVLLAEETARDVLRPQKRLREPLQCIHGGRSRLHQEGMQGNRDVSRWLSRFLHAQTARVFLHALLAQRGRCTSLSCLSRVELFRIEKGKELFSQKMQRII